jgi:hypothetical protein
MRYWVSNVTAPWKFAREACRGRGAELASIPNAQAAAIIASLVQAQLGSVATNGVWIGASDLDSEGSFKWSDGSPWSYSNWWTQPVSAFSVDKDCVEMMSAAYSWKWNDTSCGTAKPYVCAVPGASDAAYATFRLTEG